MATVLAFRNKLWTQHQAKDRQVVTVPTAVGDWSCAEA
jgi:hypothetical protein